MTLQVQDFVAEALERVAFGGKCGVARSLPAQPPGKEDINQHKQRDFEDRDSSLLFPHCFPSVSQQIAFSSQLEPLWPLLTAAHSTPPLQSLTPSLKRLDPSPFGLEEPQDPSLPVH